MPVMWWLMLIFSLCLIFTSSRPCFLADVSLKTEEHRSSQHFFFRQSTPSLTEWTLIALRPQFDLELCFLRRLAPIWHFYSQFCPLSYYLLSNIPFLSSPSQIRYSIYDPCAFISCQVGLFFGNGTRVFIPYQLNLF